jgi:hypothetical protein
MLIAAALAVFLGPNAPIGHGSVLPIVEHAAKYMIRVMRKVQMQGIKSIEPNPAAIHHFQQHVSEFMKRMAWSTKCRSWFKNGTIDGPVIALHPGGRIHWFHMLEEPRYEDFIYTHLTPNIFQYLGNGFSTREEEGQDATWYFDSPENLYHRY